MPYTKKNYKILVIEKIVFIYLLLIYIYIFIKIIFTKKYYLVWLKNDLKVALPFWTSCLGKVVNKIKAFENYIYFNFMKCYLKGIYQIQGLLFFDFTKMFYLYIHLKTFYSTFFLNSFRFVNYNGCLMTIFDKASNRA